MLNIIVQTVSLLILTLLYYSDSIPNYIDKGFIINIFIVLIVCTCSFFGLRKENAYVLKKQYIKMSLVFIIGFFIVHFQSYIDLILGFASVDNYFLWIDKSVVNDSVTISSIALICYYLGYSLRSLAGVSETIRNKAPKSIKVIDFRILKYLAIVFFLLFLFNIDKSFLDSSNYSSRTLDTSVGLYSLFFECTIFSIIILNARNLILVKKTKISVMQYIRSYGFVFILFIFYIIAIMLSGDRGPIIYCILSMLYGYILITKTKFSLSTIMIGIVALASFITLLGLIRGLNSDGDFSNKLVKVIEGDVKENRVYPNSFSNATKELAGSVRTVHLAVANVPSRYDHFYGLFFIQNISVIVPGLNSSMNEFFQIPRAFFTSARFLTFLDLGAFGTWGVGTSCVADVYLDFGVLGIIIIFGLFGYFFRKIELISYVSKNPSIFTIAISLLFFSYSIYISRSNLLVPFTKLTYVMALCYLPIILKRK